MPRHDVHRDTGSAALPRIGLILPGLMLAMLLGALDHTIMAPALPFVAGDLGGLDQMPAVVTAYLVAATVVMPLYGKLGDRFGRRPVMQAAILIFVAGAVLSGLAPSMPALIAARAIQGAGGGGLMIGAQAIIGEIVSPRERGRYLALIGSAYIIAAVAGPVIGGFVVDHLTWRWIFTIHPVLGLVALIAITLTLRLPRPTARPPIDYAGALTLATAVIALVLLTDIVGRGGDSASPVAIPALIGLTLTGLVAWLVTARRATDPIIPLRLFRDPAFAIPGAISFLIGFAMFGTISYTPAFLQIALGSSATRAGLLLTVLMAGVIATTVVSGRLITRTGRYKVFPIVGTAMAAAGLGLFATVDSGSGTATVTAALILLGLGIGLVMQVMVLAVQNSVEHRHLGAATSTVTFLRQIGSSVGVAAIGALITLRFTERLPTGAGTVLDGNGGAGSLTPQAIADLPGPVRDAVAQAFGDAVPPVFGLTAPLLLLAFVLALALPARPLRTTAHIETAPSPRGRITKEAPRMTDRGPAQRFAAPIDAFGRDDLDRAGGKGANLGELVRNGFLVPGGFIVTTDAYTAAVERTDLAERIAEHVAGLRATDAGGDTAPATDGAALRAAFDAAAVPDDIRAAIADAYAELGGGPVAVRSSATAEDLPGAAFAGQQDTYLNIIGERAVIDAVARCWASLWTDRAIAYRRHRGIDSGEVSIAVVVQSMVEAESAGVMFSANPVTGDRGEVVIDASSGLGEAVVSGLVTPDHYVLDTSGKLKEWRGGRREVVIHGTADGGVTHGSEPAPPPDKPQLPAPVLRELASLGTRVAAHFGRPQDMEWAYADGEVRLLQARPMTAVPPPPVRLNPVQRRIGSMVMDYATQRPYPLDMTTWLAHGPVKMVAVMMASVGIRADLPKSFPEEDGVVTRYIPPMPRPTLKVLAAPFSIAARARRHDPARWTNDARFLAFERGIDELNDRDLEALTWAELLRVPRTAMDLLGEVTDLRVDYLPAALVALLRLRLALARLGLTTLMADLLIAPTRTTDCNRALEALAEQVRRSPRLYADFARLDPDELAELVAGTTAPATEYEHTEAPDDPDLARFRADFRAFLAEYGHRETASPILISPPTWIESPATVLGLIRMLLDQDTAGAAPGDRSRAAEERLLAHPRLRRAGRRARMMRRVEAARVGMALREDTHFYFTRSMPPLRRSLMEMGRRLRDAGVLRTPGDVFHLRFEELESIADVPGLPPEQAEALRATALRRAAKRDELAGVRLIDPTAIFPRPPEGGDALVSGTPASGGRATGPARVIRDPAEFGELRRGDILVCPYTNPAWTPLFQRAAAVVVDSGGAGSHAAIVAREYGIPAVMGTGVATTELTSGRIVTVDGDVGEVSAAQDAPGATAVPAAKGGTEGGPS